MSSEPSLFEVFYKGNYWDLVPGCSDDAAASFGGPFSHHVESPLDLDEAVIHNVGTLTLSKFGVGTTKFGFTIPLIFGICHEGCSMTYRKIASHAIEITSISSSAADDGFPYHGYPPVIPYYRLGFGKNGEIAREKLSDLLHNTGWTISESNLYVIVRQHPNVGHCLFEGGDDVEIVFEYSPDTGEFRVTTQCD
jgi:hypothetical protein